MALREERRVGPASALLILAAWTLQNEEHMAVPVIDELADDYTPAGEMAECPYCHTRYRLAYPGQPYCSHACAAEARKIIPPDILVRPEEIEVAAEILMTTSPQVTSPLPPPHQRSLMEVGKAVLSTAEINEIVDNSEAFRPKVRK